MGSRGHLGHLLYWDKRSRLKDQAIHPNMTIPLTDPYTFVGWSADKYIAIISSGLNYDHIHFIQHIPEGMTLNGLGIKDAIEYARTRDDVVDVYVNGNQFKVLGAQDIGINAYNQ
jgi:hypothetical protein